MAFLEAQVKNYSPEVAGEVQKFCTATGVACVWGRLGSMGRRSEMLNRRSGFSKSGKD